MWESMMRGLLSLSARTVRWIEQRDLRSGLGFVVATAAGFSAFSLFASGVPLRIPAHDAPLHIVDILIAAAAMGGEVVAARARNLLTVMLAVGLTGFSVAIMFMTNGAPDLSITQFAVEALLVVLLTVILVILPLTAPPTRLPWQRRVDLALAVSLALILLVGLIDMASADPAMGPSDYYGKMAYVAAKGHNVVNVILVDFRGFDTLGETVVIAAAAILGASLLAARSDVDPLPPPAVHFSFRTAAGGLFWLLLIASIVILLRGHDQPGGGFVGGLVAALAFAILSLARGTAAAGRTLRVAPLTLVGVGLAATSASGVAAMFGGKPFLTHLWWEPGAPIPKLSTTMLFDAGVYLIVLGAVVTFLFGLQRERVR